MAEILRKYFWTDFAKNKYYIATGVALQLILAKYSLIEPLSVNDLNNLYEVIVSALRNCNDSYLRKCHQSIKFKWSKQLSHLKHCSREARLAWCSADCPNVGPMVGVTKQFYLFIPL